MVPKILLLIAFLSSGFLLSSFSERYLPQPATDLTAHRYYTLSYNRSCKEANWVYYVLTDSMVLNKGQERTNRFSIDKMVAGGSAKPSDYTKSGFDRGHLCPAADMGFNATAMEESFLMSNVTPQVSDFNRGVWKELETAVRDWAIREHRLIVVTGPVFKDNKGTIGKDKVVVPGYFFKILFDTTGEPRMIAFVIPNKKTDRPLTDFAVPVDKVESLTGYDFFSQLPDNEEEQLESKVVLAGWFKGYEKPDATTQEAIPDHKTRETDNYFYLILLLVLGIVILFVFLNSKRK
jgi:endonuclease G